MSKLATKATSLLLIAALTGCAVSRNTMIDEGNTLSNTSVCRNYLLDHESLPVTAQTYSRASTRFAKIRKSEIGIGEESIATSDAEDYQEELPAADEGQTDEEEALYLAALSEEIKRRGLTQDACEDIVKSADAKIAVGILGAIAVGAAAAAASNSGGSGYSSGYSSGYTPTYTTGYGHAWDQFYGSYGTLQWRCRSTSTGRFATDSTCAGKPMVDTTWPGK